jgi:hypothetical protein
MLKYQILRVSSRIVTFAGQTFMAKEIGKFLQLPCERWNRDQKPYSIVEVDLRNITTFVLDYTALQLLVLLHGRGISYGIKHYGTANGT